MKSVKQLLKQKDQALYTISPKASVLECIKLLSEKGIGALLVMEGHQLVGIISERDYARKIALEGKSSQTTLVEEIMTKEVLCAKPMMTNEECIALMSQKRIRHLPVIENEQVVGIISTGDLLRDIMDEQQFAIQELERYIHGHR